MAKKVKNSSSTTNSMNFRPVVSSVEKKLGTKPLPNPQSIQQVMMLMVIHLCRKILYIDPNIKVGVYIILVFFGSILGDVVPIPKSYFSRKENMFNVYFVKFSWAWTIGLVGSFVFMSSQVYSAGDKVKVKKHMFRLIIATVMWFFFTKSFVYIEERYVTLYT